MKFKYYPYPDLSFGYKINQIEKEIDNILSKDNDIKMNLERFEILKYFNDSNFELYNNKKFVEKAVNYKKKINRNISIYFNNEVILKEELKEIYKNSPEYVTTFLEVVSYYKLDGKENYFEPLLIEIPNRHISSILANKYIVNKYPSIIAKKILKDSKNAEILIKILMLNSDYVNYFLPDKKFLSLQQINEILLQYIQLKDANPNYLKSLYQEKFSIEIATRARSMAKEAYDNSIKKMVAQDKLSGITTEVQVEITILKNKIINVNDDFKNNKFNRAIQINEDWLNNSLDFNSILQNFIYVFQLVDNRFRFGAIPTRESEGVLERSFKRQNKNEYFTSSVFRINEIQYVLLYKVYELYLERKQVNMLEVIRWYLTVFLEDEYKIQNFDLNLIDHNLSKKILNNELHTQFQRLIKMYNLYSKYEEVNLKEVDIETHRKFNELKSINGIKYIYLKNSELIASSHHLFSDQSVLGILNSDNKFYKSLENGEIWVKDIKEDLLSYITLLKNKDLIKINNGLLTISSDRYFIIKELFFNYTINYYWVSDKEKKILDTMIDKDEVRTSNSLLSEEEVKYFDYYLNDYFSNGLALRNKYSHGSTGELSEKEHEKNYTLLSYLIVLFIIKINEEFNYKFDYNNSLN